MRATERIQEFAVPAVSTRDYIEFSRAWDAWMIRRGFVEELQKRKRFAKSGQRKASK